MERRGQAAMEFLMTYGWAILAAVIAIAVLAYFGVFSPSRYIPNTCQISAPLGCNTDLTRAYETANLLELTIVNGGAEDITLQSVLVTNCDTVAEADTTSIVVGTEETIDITCDGGLVEGDKLRGTITVTYSKGAITDLISSGSLTTTVRA